MTWYCAHIIIGIRKKADDQSPISVEEDVVLLEADSFDEAMKKAEILGKQEEMLDDALTVNDMPAIRIFAGVRKVISIRNEMPPADEVPPSHGSEVTYSMFEVSDMETLMKLGRGEVVTLRYIE